MISLNERKQAKYSKFSTVGNALLLYLFYLGIPALLVVTHLAVDKLLIKSAEGNYTLFDLGIRDTTMILIILYVIVLIVMIFSIMIFAYNLYYLKTEPLAQAIYGIFEVFYAIIAFILFFFSQSTFVNNENLILYAAYIVGLYVPVYVVIRGFESIGKRYKNKQGVVFWLKFGTNDDGKAIHYSTRLLGVARYFEKSIKESNKTN